MKADRRRRLTRFLAGLVPVGWVTGLLLMPYVLLLVQSFWRLENGVLTHELTLDNYRRLFGTALYPNTILFSAGIALQVTLFSLLLAYPLAYLLAFKVKKHRNLMYMAVIIPLWVSYLVRAYAWKTILGQSGVLNGLLLWLGIIDQPLTVLLYSKWALVIALTHIYVPFTPGSEPGPVRGAMADLSPDHPASVPSWRDGRVHLCIRAQHGRLPRPPASGRQ